MITGCLDGGLGAALAVAFHEAGLHVYATARNPTKMSHVASLGIETLTLDVQSEASITACVQKLTTLDILVNNAGAGYSMPVSDIDISEAKKLFDLNVWSCIAVTQAFLPLLLKSKGIIVNHTSVASAGTAPFQSAYNASKAAMAVFSDSQRLELEPFGIKVVDLKTGIVQSNFLRNQKATTQTTFPKDSIYQPVQEVVEKAMFTDGADEPGMTAQNWAKQVVRELMKKKPPPCIWKGTYAGFVRVGTVLPFGMLDGVTKKMSGIDIIEQKLKKES